MSTGPLQPIRPHISSDIHNVKLTENLKTVGSTQFSTIYQCNYVYWQFSEVTQIIRKYLYITLNEDDIGHTEQLQTEPCGPRATHH
jgi:hypothetical protein